MTSSAFTPTVLTISSSSQATGEKNYISATDSNVTGAWLTGGSGVTVATSTTNLPDNITRTSSIGFTRASASTGYGYARFTLDQADYGKKFKIQWDQIYGGVAGDFQLRVFSNTASDYSGTSTQLTVATAAIAAITGTFTTSVDMPGATAPYIEVRIVSNGVVSASTTLYLAGILIGPGTISQGAVISEWQSYTPTFSNVTLGTGSAVSAFYRRVGSSIEIEARFILGTGGSVSSFIAVPLPAGLTVNTSALASSSQSNLGTAYCFDDSPGLSYIGNVRYVNARSQIEVIGHNINGSWTSNLPMTWAVSDFFSVHFSVPVNEWAGSGTVNLGPGAQVEYASNNGSGGTAANTTYSTGMVSGPAGSNIVAVASTTSSYFSTKYKVQFQTPIQDDDLIQLEIQQGGTGTWRPVTLSQYTPKIQGTGYRMGIEIAQNDSTSVLVCFGNGGAFSSSATFDAAGIAWSGETSQKWRVRKAKASAPVGFGLVTGTDSGLMKATSTLGLMRYNTSNGYGTTNTAIRRFSTLISNTSSVIYTDTAAAGSSFTITESGVYTITYADSFSAVSLFGLSRNSTQLNVNIANITAADRLIVAHTSAANLISMVSWSGYLSSGDVIRPHTDAATSGTTTVQCTFTIQRIA